MGIKMKNSLGMSRDRPDGATATHFLRRDFTTAALVEQGIELQKQAGTKFAAVFLDHKGVPVAVALRVLLKPNERRQNYLAAELEPMYA
jgi:hypothetical protein